MVWTFKVMARLGFTDLAYFSRAALLVIQYQGWILNGHTIYPSYLNKALILPLRYSLRTLAHYHYDFSLDYNIS